MLRFLLLSLLFGQLCALPLGNPWDASLYCQGVFQENCLPLPNFCANLTFRTGFYGDYVYNRNMQVDDDNDTANIHNTQINTNAALLVANFKNRVDLFATLGTTHIRLTTNQKVTATGPNGNIVGVIDLDTYFSSSVGGRGTLWKCQRLEIGAEAQYFFSRPYLNNYTLQGNSPHYFNNKRIKYQEWQIGLGAAYACNFVSCSTSCIPYAGLKWGRALINMGDLSDSTPLGLIHLRDLCSARNWGYALGFSLVGKEKWSATLEGNFASEKAVNVTTQFRF